MKDLKIEDLISIKEIDAFPLYEVTISREFIESILYEFKKDNIPGDQMTIYVAGKAKK